MRRSLRETSGAPFSLFAFQDIIFSVTAVLLFATIWFALSTRVQRFSHAREAGELSGRLAVTTTAVVAAEARHELRESGAAEAADEDDLQRWVRHQLQVDQPGAVAASLRHDVQEQEQRAAGHVRRLQDEAEAWEQLQRRLPRAKKRAFDALLRPVLTAGLPAPVLLVVDRGRIQLLDTNGTSLDRPLAAGAALEATLRALLQPRVAGSEWLWIGLKPSAAAHLERIIAIVEGAGFDYTIEPLIEDQAVAFHSSEGAEALLEAVP